MVVVAHRCIYLRERRCDRSSCAERTRPPSGRPSCVKGVKLPPDHDAVAGDDGNQDRDLLEAPVHGQDEDAVLEPVAAFGVGGHAHARALVAELVELQPGAGVPPRLDREPLLDGSLVDRMDEHVVEASVGQAGAPRGASVADPTSRARSRDRWSRQAEAPRQQPRGPPRDGRSDRTRVAATAAGARWRSAALTHPNGLFLVFLEELLGARVQGDGHAVGARSRA